MAKSKGSEFIPVPGEKMLEAIGLVAVKWSALEFQIDNLLYWASSPDDQDTTHVLNHFGTQQRWERLKNILRQEHSKHPGTAGLVALVDKALGIKGERDQIIHGLYSEPASKATKAEVVIITLKSHKVKTEWPVNRPRVLQAAKKIDALLAQILNHLLDHGERLGNSILTNAWRHKDRI
ncbi:hypothetical protein [Peteryoungia ipomoeae]|uniref:Uncharacterized protein n=1 Tax=Peteryoungia ipomoeae TaxID=1210932 RepID=A0A4S8P561_9HYPH|nr:hypothetical protein [Peteryoungia ipomoeae]THV22904.1 hypothetical protein FAA97_09665 [Peteryoungia ipomoeae]